MPGTVAGIVVVVADGVDVVVAVVVGAVVVGAMVVTVPIVFKDGLVALNELAGVALTIVKIVNKTTRVPKRVPRMQLVESSVGMLVRRIHIIKNPSN